MNNDVPSLAEDDCSCEASRRMAGPFRSDSSCYGELLESFAFTSFTWNGVHRIRPAGPISSSHGRNLLDLRINLLIHKNSGIYFFVHVRHGT